MISMLTRGFTFFMSAVINCLFSESLVNFFGFFFLFQELGVTN